MSYMRKTIFSDHFSPSVFLYHWFSLLSEKLNHDEETWDHWKWRAWTTAREGCWGGWLCRVRPLLLEHATWRERESVHLLEHLVKTWRRAVERWPISLLSPLLPAMETGSERELENVVSLAVGNSSGWTPGFRPPRFPCWKGAYPVALQGSKAES